MDTSLRSQLENLQKQFAIYNRETLWENLALLDLWIVLLRPLYTHQWEGGSSLQALNLSRLLYKTINLPFKLWLIFPFSKTLEVSNHADYVWNYLLLQNLSSDVSCISNAYCSRASCNVVTHKHMYSSEEEWQSLNDANKFQNHWNAPRAT